MNVLRNAQKDRSARPQRAKGRGVPSGAHGATNKEDHVCARRRVVRRPVPVEDFDELRTLLAVFFSIVSGDLVENSGLNRWQRRSLAWRTGKNDW